MSSIDALPWIERESEAFAAVIEGGQLDRRVPGCPEWTLRDLAWHLARVQRFWTRVVRAGADQEPDRPAADSTGPANAPELAIWVRASAQGLVDALRTVPFDTPAWVWWRDDRTVGAIARHQVQEAAVHRWDAQSAVGPPDPLALEIADDGVNEFMGIARQLRDPAPIRLVATDSGRSFDGSDDDPLVTVSATASDLVLLLYGRVSPARVQVEGDRAALATALLPIG